MLTSKPRFVFIVIFIALASLGIYYYFQLNPNRYTMGENVKVTAGWTTLEADEYRVRISVPEGWIGAEFEPVELEDYTTGLFPIGPADSDAYSTAITARMANCNSFKVCQDLFNTTVNEATSNLGTHQSNLVTVNGHEGTEVIGSFAEDDPAYQGASYRMVVVQEGLVLFKLDQFDDQFTPEYESILSTLEFY